MRFTGYQSYPEKPFSVYGNIHIVSHKTTAIHTSRKYIITLTLENKNTRAIATVFQGYIWKGGDKSNWWRNLTKTPSAKPPRSTSTVVTLVTAYDPPVQQDVTTVALYLCGRPLQNP